MKKTARALLDDPSSDKTVALVGELASRYLEEMERYRLRVCEHPRTEFREKTISGGGIQCKLQCLICGAPVGNSAKKRDGLPKWNDSLQPVYEASRAAERNEIQRRYIRLHNVETMELNEKSKDWQAEYSAYRRTPAWQEKRARVLKRANGVCEGCLDARATVVHHTTYAHMGDELLYQLVALCQTCHEKAHPEHHESFYDVDYVPCAQCRWGDGGVTCGRFSIPAYEALQAGGECGPGASAFEGLK